MEKVGIKDINMKVVAGSSKVWRRILVL